MSVKVGSYVARLLIADPSRRHSGVRCKAWWIEDPGDEIVGRVLEHAGDVDALEQALQRRESLAGQAALCAHQYVAASGSPVESDPSL